MFEIILFISLGIIGGGFAAQEDAEDIDREVRQYDEETVKTLTKGSK